MPSKEVIVKKIEKDFAKMTWRCKGCSFFSESYHYYDGIGVNCLFESRIDYIRVSLDIEEVPIGENEFRGERCLADATAWAGEQIIRFFEYFVRDPRDLSNYRPKPLQEYRLLCRDYAEQYKREASPPKE